MLAGDFFTLQDLKQEDGKISATIHWNAAHPIFGGHFPGQPVVPGVCMLQLVEEVLEQALGIALQLEQAGNLKFLHVIDPVVHPAVGLVLSQQTGADGRLNVAATLQLEALVFFKMNGGYVPAGE